MPFDRTYPEEPRTVTTTPSAPSSLRLDQYGNVYTLGASHSLEKKVQISLVYQSMKEEADTAGRAVGLNAFARKAGVSAKFAKKVMFEVNHGSLTDPKDRVIDRIRGKGAKTFSAVLLRIRQRCNKMALKGYQILLCRTTGTFASRSTILKWFHYRFPYKGRLKKTNMVPID
jgi:hypothetical protein